MGAAYANTDEVNGSGQAYVIFGTNAGFNESFEVSTLDGSNGFQIDGINSGDRLGSVTAPAGDINDDGIDDILISAFRSTVDGSFAAGETYVIFGSSGGFGETLKLSELNGLNGFSIQGDGSRDYSGGSLAGLGDVNGDGIDDFATGASGANSSGKSDVGEVYVIFGDDGISPASISVTELNGTNGYIIEGRDAGDSLSIAGEIGDINGDGINDLFLSARNGDENAYNSGEAYVLYGRSEIGAARIDLSDFDSTQGFMINGAEERNFMNAIGSAGDFNGDGVDDFLLTTRPNITSSNGNFVSAGHTYIVFGQSGGFNEAIEVSELDGTNGFAISNGSTAASAGDINGDGFDDLIMGLNQGANDDPSTSGQAYVIFGFSTDLSGSAENDVLNGSFLGDEIFGLDGDDELLGGRGNDLLIGGAGADILDGGDDFDIASYLTSSSGVSVDLSTQIYSGGEAEGDTLQNIEGIIGSVLDDTLIGDAADNQLEGLAGNDLIEGMAGQDNITAGAGRDTVFGGDGSDMIIGGAGADSLFGGAQDDTIEGNGGKDRLFGNEGNDFLSAGGDRDQLDGGIGNDILIGGDSGDTIQGGDGNDQIEGRRGSDNISGGAGNDLLIGNGLTDTISGGEGNDIIRGGSGRDTLNGDLGNDQIIGGAGNDTADGGEGDDAVFGGGGDDQLLGGQGNDTVSGGGGNDIISGGSGTDILSGNNGRDVFVFAAGDEEATIIDFRDNDDQIDLSDFDFVDSDAAIEFMSEVDGNVVFTIAGDSLTIDNISISDLSDNLII